MDLPVKEAFLLKLCRATQLNTTTSSGSSIFGCKCRVRMQLKTVCYQYMYAMQTAELLAVWWYARRYNTNSRQNIPFTMGTNGRKRKVKRQWVWQVEVRCTYRSSGWGWNIGVQNYNLKSLIKLYKRYMYFHCCSSVFAGTGAWW